MAYNHPLATGARYKNRDVAELFAQGKTDIRNHNGSLFVEGDVIYSYGLHFPIALRLYGEAVFNADRYSVTTSHHQSYVREALISEGYRIYEVDTITLQKYIEIKRKIHAQTIKEIETYYLTGRL